MTFSGIVLEHASVILCRAEAVTIGTAPIRGDVVGKDAIVRLHFSILVVDGTTLQSRTVACKDAAVHLYRALKVRDGASPGMLIVQSARSSVVLEDAAVHLYCAFTEV